MKRIIVDIDDTIASLHPVIRALCNDATGIYLDASDWHTYDAKILYGITDQEYSNLLINNKVLETVQPIGGAVKTLLQLEERGYAINYLTARGWHPNAKTLTKIWLKKWNFPDGKLHIVSLNQCKAEYARKHISVPTGVIDDSGQHIQQFIRQAAAGNFFLIDRPWNRSYTDLDQYRISHISESMR